MKMEDLKNLEQIILKDHPALISNLLQSCQVLQVYQTKQENDQGLKYLPNFHLIFQTSLTELLTFSVKLATYHGKTVDNIVFKLDTEGQIPTKVKQFIHRFTCGLALCQGLERHEAADFGQEDYLCEFFNDSIIVRSSLCQFIAKNGGNKCDECVKILPSIKLEPDVSITKHENYDEDFEFYINDIKGSYEEEEHDMEGGEEEDYDEEGDIDWETELKRRKKASEENSESNFVDISGERKSMVWKYFLLDKINERAKCISCDVILKVKASMNVD